MAALGVNQAACSIEIDLAKVTGRNNPVLKTKEQLGFSIALDSAENTSGFEQIPVQSNKIQPASTAKRKTYVKYRKMQCDSVTDGTLGCGNGTSEGDPYVFDEVEVDYYKVSKHIQLSRLVYQDLCSELAPEQSKRIAELAADILRQRNTDLVTKYLTLLTTYADGDSSAIGGGEEKTISLFKSDATPQPMGLMPILNNYANLGYMERPITVGGNQINSWKFGQDVFRGNVDGLDPNKGSFEPIFFDNTQDAIINDGEQHLLTWIPGHIQPLFFNKYGANTGLALSRDGVLKGVINIGGIDFDIFIEDLACNDFVNIQLGLGYDLYSIPSGAVNANCGGQLSTLNWIADCGALTCAAVK